MRRFSLHFLGACVALLFLSATQAAIVTTSACSFDAGKDCASSISGLDIAGVSYEVTFVKGSFSALNSGGSFIEFDDLSTAEGARDSIRDALNGSTAKGIDLGASDVISVYVPYEVVGSSVYLSGVLNNFADLTWINSGTGDHDVSSEFYYAAFSATPVPVPAGLWLFGSALGLVGWLRRSAK